MARLENYARAGYWPTPDRVTAAITRFLVPGQGGTRRTIRILDPCAGTGKAVAAIAATLGAESYGVELNAGRANEARGVLTRVLSNDAFAIRLTNGGFSGMLLNPPYADD